MADIFGGIAQQAGTWLSYGKYLAWFILFMIVVGLITTAIIYLIWKSKQIKVININQSNRRIKILEAINKKKKDTKIKQLWVSGVKRFLPQVQSDDIHLQGKKDVMFLMTDKNGLCHTLRIPNYEELKLWYKNVHNIDLEKKDEQGKLIVKDEDLKNIYFLPNPHENLDWLANEIAESDKVFGIDVWWKSPTFLMIATLFICFLTFIISLIIEKKM